MFLYHKDHASIPPNLIVVLTPTQLTFHDIKIPFYCCGDSTTHSKSKI